MGKFKDIILPLLLLCVITGYSQTQIDYRSDFGRVYPDNPNDIVLTKNVVFTHKDMIMYCDSAIYNQKDNYFNAYTNIRMYQGDTVSLFGDELYYDGQAEIGELFGRQVILKDNDVTLTTDYLILDRGVNTVSYYSDAVIWNAEDTLSSREGTYYIDDEDFEFLHNVVLNADKGRLTTDTLVYNTKTKQAEFRSDSSVLIIYDDTIREDSTVVISDYGKYNSDKEEVYSDSRPLVYMKDRFMTADTVYYDRKNKNGYAYGNVYAEDTVKKIFLDSDTLELNTQDTLSVMFITGNIFVRQADKEDTVYIHSDTVHIIMDTSFNLKYINAYDHFKFYRHDIQGACGYMSYNKADSSVTMLKRPVLWTEDTQLTSDTVIMLTDEKNIKELYMNPNVFILQNSDTNTQEYFNQVSGKNLKGYFAKNKLYYAVIEGNTRCIYFIWDENKKKKTKKLTGVNIGLSKSLELYFKNGELKRMSAVKDAEFYMDSYKSIPQEERRLRGFINSGTDRPRTPYDVFIKRP